MRKMKKWMFAAILICCSSVFTACTSNEDNSATNEDKNCADLVVYGKIFTSEGNQIVEAFAVKDGKYIYVGDKAGAEAYIEMARPRWWTIAVRDL